MSQLVFHECNVCLKDKRIIRNQEKSWVSFWHTKSQAKVSEFFYKMILASWEVISIWIQCSLLNQYSDRCHITKLLTSMNHQAYRTQEGMGNTFTAVTGNETKPKFSFIMHSHKFGFHKGLWGFTWFWKEIWQVIEY